MDNNYNKYCSGQQKIISDFDKINDLFDMALKNHVNNNQDCQDNNNIRILDIGCSHGKNSIIVLKPLIEQVRKQWKPNEKVIEIFHSDLSVNDFSKLFDQVYHLNSYSNKTNNIFTYGIGNGFENQLVPNNSIDFIFSFTTLQWVPFLNKYKSFEGSLYNIAFSDRLPGFENYYKKRLLNTLNNRLNELKVGGIFSFNLFIQEDKGSENEEKSKSIYNCMKNIKEILREMSYQSILTREEVENMIIPIVFLTRDEYQYAIDKSTNNTGLKLIYENRITSNWADSYQDDQCYIGSIIAIIGNFIKNAINGDKSKVDSIFNDFEQRLHLKYKLNPNDFQFNLYLTSYKYPRILLPNLFTPSDQS
ncbi:hypothetical protein ACTFIU_005871 [Dictyostelium citrinum]